MRRVSMAVVVMATTAGCFAGYDSRWGQSAAVQRQHAADHAPTLRGASDGDRATNVRTMKIRAYVARAYTTQVTDVPATLRELFADANDVVEPALGIRLELEGIRPWELARDDELPKVLGTLREQDPAGEVDWVAGFVGALPRATMSFHDLGYGDLPGRYVVMRAPSSAQEHDGIERAYAELKDEERRRVQKEHRRHRVAAIFLHEIGHTLGAMHERSERNLMYPEYRSKMTTFGAETTEIMRAVLAKRDAKAPAEQAAVFREIVAGLRRAPSGVFFEEEKQKLIPQLEANAERLDPPPRAAAPAGSAAAPVAAAEAAPSELSPDDQRRFQTAREAMSKNDPAGAWEAAKPLFAAYPKVMAVQELRCTIATNVFRFDAARLECQPLMKLSTGN
ncbi:MAG: matrixin family metalloprotease [Deltaproteobacteria bacterium]|nr:matrixin family metalloprotease [Deltaproteobacteria bacterium]